MLIIMQPFKIHPYYEDRHKWLAYIAVHPGALKRERFHIRQGGLPRNQKKGILDSLSKIPVGTKNAVFHRGELQGFA